MDKRAVLRKIDWLVDTYERQEKAFEEADDLYTRGFRNATKTCRQYMEVMRDVIDSMEEDNDSI